MLRLNGVLAQGWCDSEPFWLKAVAAQTRFGSRALRLKGVLAQGRCGVRCVLTDGRSGAKMCWRHDVAFQSVLDQGRFSLKVRWLSVRLKRCFGLGPSRLKGVLAKVVQLKRVSAQGRCCSATFLLKGVEAQGCLGSRVLRLEGVSSQGRSGSKD